MNLTELKNKVGYPVQKAKLNGKDFVVYGMPHNVSTNIKSKGVHEKAYQDEMVKFCSPDKLTIDVGAQIGAHSLPLSYCSKQVYSFEPMPASFGLLKYNIELQQRDNIVAINKAAGAKSSKADLVTVYQNVVKETDGGDVEIVAVDEELKALNVDATNVGFIKIDVEGFEFEALKGLKETIEASRPAIFLETHDDNVHKDCRKNSLDFLKQMGYVVETDFDHHHKIWKHKGE